MVKRDEPDSRINSYPGWVDSDLDGLPLVAPCVHTQPERDLVLARPSSARRLAVGAALLGVLLSACSSGTPDRTATDLPAAQAQPANASVPSMRSRLRPDVLVLGKLTPKEVTAVSRLSASAVAYAVGTATIGKTKVRVAAVNPVTFRRYAAKGTAEATAVWQAVATGQVVASHALATKLKLSLGKPVTVRGRTVAALRLGALATTGIPGTDLVVSSATGAQLGMTTATAMLLTAGKVDPVQLASKARKLTGKDAQVRLLSPPAQNPMAFLTGSRAARMFGGFSYTYHSDGTIEPEARWVRANIVTARVPILGAVTCHRLMVAQLRGALQEIRSAGLAGAITSYNGCYVPRFIERDPAQSISLHTWGIAIDLNAATNYRGIRGTMHPEVVRIFKKWGFRWGGDWKYTDPMHFELGAILRT